MDLTVILEAVGLSPMQAALTVAALAVVLPWLAALLPQNVPGRRLLDLLAANVGNARNAAPVASVRPPAGTTPRVWLALLALPALSACGTNWREAAVPAVICAMDAAGRVQAIADGHDADGVKALQAAAAAGAVLAHNAACQVAMVAAATPAAGK